MIFPFSFSEEVDWQQVCLQNSEQLKLSKYGLLEQIDQLFWAEDEGLDEQQIGRSYRMKDEHLLKLSFKNSEHSEVCLGDKKQTLRLRLHKKLEVGVQFDKLLVHIFNTQIGFIEIQLQVKQYFEEQEDGTVNEQALTVKRLYEIDKYIRRIVLHKSSKYLIQKLAYKEKDSYYFEFNSFLQGVQSRIWYNEQPLPIKLENLAHTIFIKEVKLVNEPKLEKNEENEENEEIEKAYTQFAYNLANGTNIDFIDQLASTDVVRTFENEYIGISSDCLVSVRGPLDKLNDTYQFLFFFVLYQKYTLLNRRNQVHDIHKKNVESLKAKQELPIDLLKFRQENIEFTTMSNRHVVAYKNRYNRFYQLLRNQYQIEQMLDEYEKELHEVIDYYMLQSQMNMEFSNFKQTSIIQSISYFFLPAGLTTGVLGMNLQILEKATDKIFFYVLIGVIILTALFSAFVQYLLKRDKQVPATIVLTIFMFILLMIIAIDAFY